METQIGGDQGSGAELQKGFAEIRSVCLLHSTAPARDHSPLCAEYPALLEQTAFSPCIPSLDIAGSKGGLQTLAMLDGTCSD